MELPDIKEFNKIGYSIAVVVHIHKFMHPFLSISAASIRYNQSKHNKKVANDIPVAFKEQYNSIVTVHSVPSNILCDHMKISYSQLSRTSFSLFISSGFAICPFMPVFLASCTSSAKVLAVMATIGSFPCSPGRLLIAAVAS